MNLFVTAMIFLFASSYAFAKEDWLCTEEASQIQGNSILACGIGTGKNENLARGKAFEASQAEFNRICNANSECKGQRVSVIPKRTTCDKSGQEWKCYRLLEFAVQSPTSSKGSLFGRADGRIKLRRGMKKTEVLELLGEPTKAIASVNMIHVGLTGTNGTYFTYTDARFCNKWPYHIPDYDLDNGRPYGGHSGDTLSGGLCIIAFDDDDDEVLRIYNFKSELIAK